MEAVLEISDVTSAAAARREQEDDCDEVKTIGAEK